MREFEELSSIQTVDNFIVANELSEYCRQNEPLLRSFEPPFADN
ncbi:hypothetical protein [Oceanobacillus sp. CF4.6]